MRDNIFNLAEDKSCLLAVTPDRGGSWWAALRLDTPRNFAAQSYTWDSFNAIQNTVDFSHNFTFEIEFECTVQTEARIFYISSTGSLFGLYQFSSGFVIFTTCLLGNTDTGTKYTEFTINPAGTYLTGRHVAKMVVEGNTATAYLDDVVIGAANAEYINRVTPSNLSAPTSKCGYIYSMRLTDDTTGETVWKASRDELYETNNPWPSATARNFAEEPMTWTDAMTAANQIGSDDWSFQIKMNVLSQIQHDSGEIFNNESGSPLKLYGDLIASGSAAFYLRNYVELETWTGKHELQLDVVSGNATLYVDGTLIATKPTGLSTLNFTRASKTSADIEIEFVEFLNLTTGKTVWSYPSEAERVRLLTKTNVRTDRGVFEAADTSTRWNIKTPLRWQNLTAATIMVRATVGDFPETVFSFALPANPNYSVILLRRSAENQLYASILGIHAGGYSIYRTITTDFTFVSGEEYTFALVFDIDGNFMRLYANGELLAERTLDQLVALAVDGGTTPGFMLGTTSFSDIVNSGTAVSSALVFDRALTSAEIVAFGVRRPRNFAENPMTWTSLPELALALDPTHDYRFRFEFKMRCAEYPSGKNRFLLDAGSPITSIFGAFYSPNGIITASTGLFKSSLSGQAETAGESIQIRNSGDPIAADVVHVIELNAVGNALSAYFDDGEPVIAKSTTRRTDLSIMNRAPESAFDGTIVKFQVIDLTTGETVWRANYNDLLTY